MNAVEYLLVGLAVAAAVSYLARRVRRRLGGGGCCGGSCPVAPRKIRLAAREGRDSTTRP